MPHALKLNCTSAEYHAIDAISQSRLKVFIRDPRLYYERFVEKSVPDEPPSVAQQLGLDIERLVLYGQMPGANEDGEIVIIPAEKLNSRGHRMGKPWQDYQSEMLAAKPSCRLLTQREFDEQFGALLSIQQAVYAHPRARRLLDGAERHVAIVWQDEQTGLPCKAQLDAHRRVGSRDVIADLKSCRNSAPEPFNRAIWDYGYHIQGGFYRTAWLELTGDEPIFAFIAAETKPAYSVETHDLDPEWFLLAEQIIRPAMQKLKLCYEDGVWNRPTWGKVNTLKPLPWMKTSTETTLCQWMD